MTKRNWVLVGLLALSWLVMVADLAYRYPGESGVLAQATLGVLLIGGVLLWMLLCDGQGRVKGLLRALKVLVATGAVVFAGWFGISMLLLLVIGPEGFRLVAQPWFPGVLAGATLLVAPVVAKRLT